MDVFAVKQACKFAKEHALKNGPIVSFIGCSDTLFEVICSNYGRNKWP